jgi:DNA (cytosine-5)-methyltransferase 1
MKNTVYYNEFDPFAAAWLKELIKAGLIPKGDVDERSITEVSAKDVEGYSQCHFFAGIGGWPLALKESGWGDRPIWTGSCPCQPFSSAGKQNGIKDDRHLWPAFFGLIKKRRPTIVFGEQVAAAIRKGWLDIVFGDLEREKYACGAVVYGAHSVGGPHIRQRLYWVGDSEYGGSLSHHSQSEDGRNVGWTGENGNPGRLANTAGKRLEGPTGARLSKQARNEFNGRENNWEKRQTVRRSSDNSDDGERGGEKNPEGKGFWKEWEWLSFRDGKRRPIEPGTFPLVDGVPNRMGRLRGYGNALCVPSAQAFIEAYLEVANVP